MAFNLRNSIFICIVFATLSPLVPTVSQASNRLVPAVENGRTVYTASEPLLSLVKADTTWILPPGAGDFQITPGSPVPSLDGWTGFDLTASTDIQWNISTYNAQELDPNQPGNRAWWCGSLDFPTCTPTDTIGGYGDNWSQNLNYETPITCGGKAAINIRVDYSITVDIDDAHDRLTLEVKTDADDDWTTEEVFETMPPDTSSIDTKRFNLFSVPCSISTNTLFLRFAFRSDGAWSDEDCAYPTHGAAQIDNIRVFVDGILVDGHVESCEIGDPIAWNPSTGSGVGDFSSVWPGLMDNDPCNTNTSPQIAFIDDGAAVPCSWGFYGSTWAYGPWGYAVNSVGGCAGLPNSINNEIRSPEQAWPNPAYNSAVLSFDVYQHSLPHVTSPGMFYTWRVRSTASINSADIESAPWQEREIVYYGDAAYRRSTHDISDLLTEDRRWVQVAIGVRQIGEIWGMGESDTSPAPYFDNVSLFARASFGPAMAARTADLANDAFPEIETIDYVNLAANSVRFDMTGSELSGSGGDSIVVSVTSPSSSDPLIGAPMLKYLISPNSLFDAFRLHPTEATVTGSQVLTADGELIPNLFSFDIPDTRLIYPGDIVHYYISASTSSGTATLPANISTFRIFADNTTYPPAFTMRALPTMLSPAEGDQPSILWWNDTDDPGKRAEWITSLRNLGYTQGVDYDVFETLSPSSMLPNGLGSQSTYEHLRYYETVLYSGGNQAVPIDDHDVARLMEWFWIRNKSLLLSGDNVVTNMAAGNVEQVWFMENRAMVSYLGNSISTLIGNQSSPDVRSKGVSIFNDATAWSILSECFGGATTIDVIEHSILSETEAEFLAPDGSASVYPYAAATSAYFALNVAKTVTLPYDLGSIMPPTMSPTPVSPYSVRTLVLKNVLEYFGETPGGSPTPVEITKPFQILDQSPNPFNPKTIIQYRVPQRSHVSILVYDLKGRLVRTLLDEPVDEGLHSVTWQGNNDQGQSLPSGVYFGLASNNGTTESFKMMLLK